MDVKIIEEKFNWYLSMLDGTYDEAIKKLLIKYGEVKEDYFREPSYKRFLNGEIKNITKGQYSRANEGLECHHIFENQYINIGSKDTIYDFKYPFQIQKKENLVYCDIIEHFILHVLIVKETNGEFGEGGSEIFLRPKIEDWLISKKIPKPQWMKKCIERAFLPKYETKFLLKKSDEVLKDYHEMRRLELLEWKKQNVEERKKIEASSLRITVEELEQRKKEEITQIEQEKKNIELQNIEKIDNEYQNLKSVNINYTSSRKQIIKAIYQIDKDSKAINFKEFYKKNNDKYKEELFDVLNTLLDN